MGRTLAQTAATPRTKMSAAERREQLIDIAFGAFAAKGFHGTSTEPIARQAGISHAYLFRVFPTKKELFIACGVRANERTRATFRAAADAFRRGEIADGPPTLLAAMGNAYRELLTDREILMMQMQLWAASGSDDDVQAIARREYLECFKEIQKLSGADPQTLHDFMARGMLLSVAASMALTELADDEPLIGLLPHMFEHDH